LNIKDSSGYAFTFDLHVQCTRHTTVGELKSAAAEHATRAKTFGDVSAAQISMQLDGRLGELDDAITSEQLGLFAHASKLKLCVRDETGV
jgi:hypothetical protein